MSTFSDENSAGDLATSAKGIGLSLSLSLSRSMYYLFPFGSMSDCIAASTSNKYVVQYFLYRLNYTFDNKINELAHFPFLFYSFGSGIYSFFFVNNVYVIIYGSGIYDKIKKISVKKG